MHSTDSAQTLQTYLYFSLCTHQRKATEPHGLRHSEISSPGMEKNEKIPSEIKMTIVSVGQALYIIVRNRSRRFIPDPM